MSKRSISEVTKVTDINMNFVKKFIETASDEDITWILDTFNECHKSEKESICAAHSDLNEKEIANRADRQYFGAFRSKFAEKYYPELLAKNKNPKSKNSPLLVAIEKRRAVLGVTN